ncbi:MULTISPECIES: lipoprotein [unclassified Acinetobacter]|uniref:LPS translocon maturation chaperone LptM n=1 Tax=unclassified Acinetobacter TaxID=196816 RepID=UPI0035B7E0D5
MKKSTFLAGLIVLLTACGQTGALTLAKDEQYDKRSHYLLYKNPHQAQPSSAPVTP